MRRLGRLAVVLLLAGCSGAADDTSDEPGRAEQGKAVEGEVVDELGGALSNDEIVLHPIGGPRGDFSRGAARAAFRAAVADFAEESGGRRSPRRGSARRRGVPPPVGARRRLPRELERELPAIGPVAPRLRLTGGPLQGR